MTDILRGIRVLEVAEHTFVPAASAILAEWGAEVVKIEHVERGDAMRGLASSGTVSLGGGAHVLLEHSNRGKQSLGLNLTAEAGLDILYRLAAASDVFLTNKLPSIRKKLRIGLDDIRAHSPDIIYVCGGGQGEKGPDHDKGSYDSLAYWARSSVAAALTPEDADEVVGPPGPAFGDSIGAMTIAGGIMGALFHRERTGEATTVDVSLLGWACGRWERLSPCRFSTRPRGGAAPRTCRSATLSATSIGPRTAGLSSSPVFRRASTGRRPVRWWAAPSWPKTSGSPTPA